MLLPATLFVEPCFFFGTPGVSPKNKPPPPQGGPLKEAFPLPCARNSGTPRPPPHAPSATWSSPCRSACRPASWTSWTSARARLLPTLQSSPAIYHRCSRGRGRARIFSFCKFLIFIHFFLFIIILISISPPTQSVLSIDVHLLFPSGPAPEGFW